MKLLRAIIDPFLTWVVDQEKLRDLHTMVLDTKSRLTGILHMVAFFESESYAAAFIVFYDSQETIRELMAVAPTEKHEQPSSENEI